MASNTLTYEETETREVYDKETGSIKATEQTKVRKVKVEKEPSFIKLYLNDICKLNNIPKSSNAVLNELLKHTNYENEIVLNMGIKKRMIVSLDTTIATLNNSISKLNKAGIIKKIDSGIYKLTPYIFGKGEWANIKKIRIKWEYGKNFRAMSQVAIDNEDLEETFKDFKLPNSED